MLVEAVEAENNPKKANPQRPLDEFRATAELVLKPIR